MLTMPQVSSSKDHDDDDFDVLPQEQDDEVDLWKVENDTKNITGVAFYYYFGRAFVHIPLNYRTRPGCPGSYDTCPAAY
jgi:hypothetical protein